MIVPAVALLGVLCPLLLGGRLALLGRVRLRHVAVLVVTFVAQFAALQVLPGPRAVLAGVHVASYVAAGWVVVVNRAVPGVALLGVGALLNGVTITLNGGTLPASPRALEIAGLSAESGFANSAALADPVLPLLGDVFAVPAGWPLANVFSVGDVLIVLGATYASVRICGTRWTRPWTAPARHLFRLPPGRPTGGSSPGTVLPMRGPDRR